MQIHFTGQRKYDETKKIANYFLINVTCAKGKAIFFNFLIKEAF